jgi:hypothetical protein
MKRSYAAPAIAELYEIADAIKERDDKPTN